MYAVLHIGLIQGRYTPMEKHAIYPLRHDGSYTNLHTFFIEFHVYFVFVFHTQMSWYNESHYTEKGIRSMNMLI